MIPPVTVAAPTRYRHLPLALMWCASAAYLVAALSAMALLSPRVPYADQWRFYARLITAAFPHNVLAADNGHREVLPNLIRLAELRWFDADQSLQIALGILLMLLSVFLLGAALWRDSVSRAARTSAIFVGVLGIVWLGNERALAHANESVHAYLVIALLLMGLRLIARASSSGTARSLLATGCALAATFSFGSGIACLPAFLLMLWLRRAGWPVWAPVLIGLLLALVLYTAGGSGTETLSLNPFVQVSLLLRWLAAPFVYLFWPLLDAHAAAQLPAGSLRDISLTIAQWWGSAFGDVQRSAWPQTALGAIGVGLFALACWRARRDASAQASGLRVALSLAGFSLIVGGMIAVSRSAYFATLPEQINAPRYLVWSSLFWSGLLSARLLKNATHRGARVALYVALGVATLVAPSEVWMGRLGLNLRMAAEQVALGGVIGVLDRDEPMGETQFDELAAALPLLQQRQVAMYAWPEVAWLGKSPPGSLLREWSVTDQRTRAVVNRFEGKGSLVEMNTATSASRLLILDARGIAVGLMLRYPRAGPAAWRGAMRGEVDIASLSFAQLR